MRRRRAGLKRSSPAAAHSSSGSRLAGKRRGCSLAPDPGDARGRPTACLTPAALADVHTTTAWAQLHRLAVADRWAPSVRAAHRARLRRARHDSRAAPAAPPPAASTFAAGILAAPPPRAPRATWSCPDVLHRPHAGARAHAVRRPPGRRPPFTSDALPRLRRVALHLRQRRTQTAHDGVPRRNAPVARPVSDPSRAAPVARDGGVPTRKQDDRARTRSGGLMVRHVPRVLPTARKVHGVLYSFIFYRARARPRALRPPLAVCASDHELRRASPRSRKLAERVTGALACAARAPLLADRLSRHLRGGRAAAACGARRRRSARDDSLAPRTGEDAERDADGTLRSAPTTWARAPRIAETQARCLSEAHDSSTAPRRSWWTWTTAARATWRRSCASPGLHERGRAAGVRLRWSFITRAWTSMFLRMSRARAPQPSSAPFRSPWSQEWTMAIAVAAARFCNMAHRRAPSSGVNPHRAPPTTASVRYCDRPSARPVRPPSVARALDACAFGRQRRFRRPHRRERVRRSSRAREPLGPRLSRRVGRLPAKSAFRAPLVTLRAAARALVRDGAEADALRTMMRFRLAGGRRARPALCARARLRCAPPRRCGARCSRPRLMSFRGRLFATAITRALTCRRGRRAARDRAFGRDGRAQRLPHLRATAATLLHDVAPASEFRSQTGARRSAPRICRRSSGVPSNTSRSLICSNGAPRFS